MFIACPLANHQRKWFIKEIINYSMNLEEKRETVRSYLRQHPNATCQQIRDEIRLRLERIYTNGNCVKNAYLDANIPFSKALNKRTKQQMKEQVIEYIKTHKNANTVSIKKDIGIDIPKTFKTIRKAYNDAGIEYNPSYDVSGSALTEIRKRSIRFENKIFTNLEKFGNLKRKVKTINKKEADGLLIYKNQRIIIEIKNYTKRNITFSEIKQIKGYMDCLECKKGLIIHSFNKNKKLKMININDSEIGVLHFDQINNIPEILKDKTL